MASVICQLSDRCFSCSHQVVCRCAVDKGCRTPGVHHDLQIFAGQFQVHRVTGGYNILFVVATLVTVRAVRSARSTDSREVVFCSTAATCLSLRWATLHVHWSKLISAISKVLILSTSVLLWSLKCAHWLHFHHWSRVLRLRIFINLQCVAQQSCARRFCLSHFCEGAVII